jgi:hypothetical protein
MNRRVCPECNGWKVIEHESNEHMLTPDGDYVRTWIDDCQLCGGDGWIEVQPIEMEDLQ